MQKCSYCGRENEDGARNCRECGTALQDQTDFQRAPETATGKPPRINLEQLEGAFTIHDGFSRPMWPIILAALRPCHASEERLAAWRGLVSQWASRWEAELGDDFGLTSSGSFFLLSKLDGEAAERILQKANRLANNIRDTLGSIAWEDRPYVLIVHMADEILAKRFEAAVYSPNGETYAEREAAYCAPYWMLLCDQDQSVTDREIESGVVWSALSHRRLPRWVYEGVGAQLLHAIDLTRGGRSLPFFDLDLIPEHRRFWNETNIQSFWAGNCPPGSSDASNLCYELSKILVHFLNERTKSLADFLRCAHCQDAGQSAALVCLKTDLGELAGTFLGPGHWTPDTLAIAECWDRRPSESADEERG